ncbi:MAG: hypothetical protein K8F58_13960 [Bauldia sp.]|nr:hypothetical protein [Bauldia sp.]
MPGETRRAEGRASSDRCRFSSRTDTVAKRRKRAFVHDAPMGPKVVRSTVLMAEEEAAFVVFGKHTQLSPPKFAI